ncbi:hypothetical protein M3231_01100 [Neobacillus mesonae]|nr:hypothetical protein [Neobacillus mesonae]
MKRVNLLTILLLFFTIGCMGRGDALDKNGFLESFQSSLRSQGLEVKKVQPSSNATMENEVPYKFSI